VRADERGDTLIEILVAVVVIAMAVTAIVGALVAGLDASAQHRNLATDDTLLRSYAEAAKQQIELQANPLYEACATKSDYNGTVQFEVPATSTSSTTAASPLPSVSITNVEYWNGASFSNSISCSNDLQLIEITATSGGASQTISVVVRNPKSKYASAS
jgi:Tfp pilus assembly protein PilV